MREKEVSKSNEDKPSHLNDGNPTALLCFLVATALNYTQLSLKRKIEKFINRFTRLNVFTLFRVC